MQIFDPMAIGMPIEPSLTTALTQVGIVVFCAYMIHRIEKKCVKSSTGEKKE